MNEINQMLEGKWNYYKSNLNYSYINDKIIDDVLEEFKKEIINKLQEDRIILLQFRIKSGVFVRNISTIDTIRLSDFFKIPDRFKAFWELKMSEYGDLEGNLDIIIAYNLVPIKITEKLKNRKLKDINVEKTIPSLKISGYNLPSSMDFSKWGDCKIDEDYSSAIVFKRKQLSNSLAKFSIKIREREIYVDYIVNNEILLSFIDKMDDWRDLSTFTRIILNKKNEISYEYIYKDGKIILKKKKYLKINYLKKIKLNEYLKDNFITMDLETRVIDDIISVYCCCIYDGTNLFNFYLTDYKNEHDLLVSAINSLLKRKYRGWSVYLHNFSNFDGIFLLKILSELSLKINPIINDNNLININLKYSEKNYINFRDSYLLLPSSLKKLAKTFNVENKSIFPYKFVNIVNLNYNGEVPSIEFFDNITTEEYNLYIKNFNKNWNLKVETIKYCSNDVKILYNIIKEFNRKIFTMTRLNAINYPTLPSLAMAIYRSNYLDNSYKIPIINGKIYDFLKNGYLGGAVDVYRPIPINNNKIYRYDVNSLYPYVMSQMDMPVGSPTYFEGDICSILNDPFGFFEVEIETTEYLKHPIILYKTNKVEKRYNSIAPLGKWKGVYFSEELKNAKKNGYKYKILRGFLFEKKKIFKEYVNTFYELKNNVSKEDPMYLISKLLLNSLYGKFGMSPNLPFHSIVSDSEIYDIIQKYDLLSSIDLKNGKQLISYSNLKNENSDDDYNNSFFSSSVNIAISSAVTSYGRVFMSQFKNSKEFDLCYSDTDSIDIDKPLNNSFIGKEIGKMKLEKIFKDCVYIAPKVYGGITLEDEEVIKIKGAKKKIKYEELKSLLYLNSNLNINHEKWVKNISDGNINIKNESYNLKITSNKRQLIFNSENIFIDTKPYVIEDDS